MDLDDAVAFVIAERDDTPADPAFSAEEDIHRTHRSGRLGNQQEQ